MNRRILKLIATIFLPILVPMAIAAVMINLGTGPTVEDVMDDFNDPDPEVRKNALKWMAPLRRTAWWEPVVPLLYDEDKDNREYAARVLEKTKTPDALPALGEALEVAMVERPNETGDVLQAIFNMRYPQTMPYLERVYHDETTTQKNRERAGDYIIQTRRALNQEVCFYSLGDHIWNELGHTIYSQAVLFPEGRKTIEQERARDGKVAQP